MDFSEMVDLVGLCGYPGYEFIVRRDGRGEIYLQAGYMEPDTVTGVAEWQLTRRWFLSPQMTDSEIVQTVFKCVITSMEHRAREWFTYKAYPVFGPHFDVEALVEICRANRFTHRVGPAVPQQREEVNMETQQIAQICHDANRSYCQTIGDNSQPLWDDAPSWQRKSAITGVEFHLNNLKAGLKPVPSASHESWLKEKTADGWKYGPTKNVEAKEHPCFVPYNELPLEQRMKDYIFTAIVEAFWTANQVEAVAA